MNLFLLPPIGDGPDLCNASHLAATALIGTKAVGLPHCSVARFTGK
jgi:hypothetical protein